MILVLQSTIDNHRSTIQEQSSIINPKDWFDGDAALRIGNGPVNLAEAVKLYEAVEGKFPSAVQVDQFGDKALWNRITLDDPKSFPSF